MRTLSLFLHLPLRRKLLLIEAGVLLLLVRPLTSLHIKHWTRLLGATEAETTAETAPLHRRAVQEVAWSLRSVSPHVFWRADCLPQALAAWFMLRRRGVPCTLYLGAQFTPDRAALKAHAWVRAGSVIVTGAPGHRRFSIVSAFAWVKP